MFLFDKLLSILHGALRFPKPKAGHRASAKTPSSDLLRAEDGYVSGSRTFLRFFSLLIMIAVLSSAVGFAQTGGRIAGSVKTPLGLSFLTARSPC